MNEIGRRSSVKELRALPDLFYFERDARSNARIKIPPHSAPISIRVSDNAARSVNGQIVLMTVLNVLLRTGRAFAAPHISVPDVPLELPVLGIAEKRLPSAIRELASRIDPHNQIAFDRLDYGVQIVIGRLRVPSAQRIIAPGVKGESALLRGVGFESTKGSHPLGAIIAANTAISELYKEIVPGHSRGPVRDVDIFVPQFSGRIHLDHTLLVGAGGIAHALAWALQWLKVDGSIAVADFDSVEISNLNRYLCAFLEDLDFSKPKLLSAVLRGMPGVHSTALTGKYEMLRDKDSLDLADFDHVITAVDNGIARLEVQSDLPKSLFNAGTNAWSFEASRHNFLEDACLGCLFPPRSGVDYQHRVACDERHDVMEQNPNDSYSFVTGLAGAFLAVHLSTLASSQRASFPNFLIGSALQVDGILLSQRKKDSECLVFCGDESVQRYFRAKHRVAAHRVAHAS